MPSRSILHSVIDLNLRYVIYLDYINKIRMWTEWTLWTFTNFMDSMICYRGHNSGCFGDAAFRFVNCMK
jgi:hypothetical protein